MTAPEETEVEIENLVEVISPEKDTAPDTKRQKTVGQNGEEQVVQVVPEEEEEEDEEQSSGDVVSAEDDNDEDTAASVAKEVDSSNIIPR